MPLTFTWAVTPLARDARGAAHHRPGAGLRRALHPGGRGRARAGADSASTSCTPRASKDAIAELIGGFRFGAGFGKTLSPAGAARHRRAPRRDAAEVPAARRDARPGRAARGHLRHRHPRASASTCRSAPCCSPGSTKYDGTPAAGAHGPGVPPDRRPRRAGRLRHGRHGRRAGARARHRERARRSPRPATTRRSDGGSQRKKPPEGFVVLDRADLRPAGRRPSRSRWSRGCGSPTRCCSTSSPGEGQPEALHTLVLDNHEDDARREALVERSVQVLRSLVRSGVVEPDDGSSVEDWLPPEPEAPPAEEAPAPEADAEPPTEAPGVSGRWARLWPRPGSPRPPPQPRTTSQPRRTSRSDAMAAKPTRGVRIPPPSTTMTAMASRWTGRRRGDERGSRERALRSSGSSASTAAATTRAPPGRDGPARGLRAQPAAVARSPSPPSTLLDPEAPTYALDVVSVIEATLDDPRPDRSWPSSSRRAARRSRR